MLIEKTKDVIIWHNNISFLVYDLNKTQILTRTVIDTWDEGKEEWIIMKDFYVWSHRIKKIIKIHRWSVTDLASIPKPFRPFIDTNEENRYAAYVHDVLYKMDYDIDRKTADEILRDICLVQGLSEFKSNLMYYGVRMGGWRYFQKPKRPIFLPDEYKEKYKKAHPELCVKSEYE